MKRARKYISVLLAAILTISSVGIAANYHYCQKMDKLHSATFSSAECDIDSEEHTCSCGMSSGAAESREKAFSDLGCRDFIVFKVIETKTLLHESMNLTLKPRHSIIFRLPIVNESKDLESGIYKKYFYRGKAVKKPIDDIIQTILLASNDRSGEKPSDSIA